MIIKVTISALIILVYSAAFVPFHVFSAEALSDNQMDEITAQDGATFILENFDFYIKSLGVTYIDAQDPDDPFDEDNTLNPGSIAFQDLVVHDGYNGAVEMSTNMDWDIYSQAINDIEYNYARFAFYNTELTMDLDVDNIQVKAFDDQNTPAGSTMNLGGIRINNLSIGEMTMHLGASGTNTGIAAEIDLSLKIDALTIDTMKYQNGIGAPVTLENIMVAGSFTGSEPFVESSKALAYTGGLWSEESAERQAGTDVEYKEHLLAINRWVPNPGSWEPHGVLKIGDVKNGNPMKMDFTVDNQAYVPFPYDIVSGEPSQDDRVEWFDPSPDKFFNDARGWKDGKDNYLSEGVNYTPHINPRYGKPYISMDAPIIGSLRMGKEGGDILILDGVNLNLHAEIPGYGYGDTPNSIPRPYPDPQLAPPRYDAPFNGLWE